VLLRGDSHALRRDLAAACARLADLEAKLRDRDDVDPCTGLPTVAAFRRAAAEGLERAEQAALPVALGLVDIDGFRALNARRGPDAGDAALAAVAAELRPLVRATDVLGRTGADEIAVLLVGSDLPGAQSCCERLISGLETAEIPGAGCITVSAGIAAHEAGSTIDTLLATAARGLDRARAEGGSRALARAQHGPANPFRAQAHVVEALSTALTERDRYTGEHSALVVDMARGVATALGLDEVEVERVAAAALLHDIGKVAIPDHILHKPGPLDDEEWALMREHPIIGERILRAIPGMRSVARIVRHEHERFDGAGYPDRLVGEAIPLGSRIILACDAYHAMTSDRPYRAAMSHGEAVGELAHCSGTQFDPRVVAALIAQLGRRRGGVGAASRG